MERPVLAAAKAPDVDGRRGKPKSIGNNIPPQLITHYQYSVHYSQGRRPPS